MLCYILPIFVILFAATPTFGVSPCGEWTAYKDEKCIKVFHDMLSYEDAGKACRVASTDANLLTIRSAEEQEFMVNFLFGTQKVHDPVWLGAKFDKTFKWADNNASIHFTNWATGSPSNSAEKACVQLVNEGASKGKWTDEPCDKMNRVVCQKLQTWSIARLQQTLLDAKEELKEQRNQMSDQRNHFQTKIEKLEKNPVPLGFIYVQLSSQPDPKSLWPAVTWKDVTTEYAGLFFRAEGGGAAPFGQVQGENAPRLTEARIEVHPASEAENHPNPKSVVGNWWWDQVDFNVGGWTSGIGLFSGSIYGDRHHTHHFHMSGGEIRPRNSAIRVWKRTA